MGNTDHIVESEVWERYTPSYPKTVDWPVSGDDGVAGRNGANWAENETPKIITSSPHFSPAHTIIWDQNIDNYICKFGYEFDLKGFE